MSRYIWHSGDRKGSGDKPPNYAVRWEWRHPDIVESYRQMVDLVYATNAERAINKVRKLLNEDINLGNPSRRDIVILEVTELEKES